MCVLYIYAMCNVFVYMCFNFERIKNLRIWNFEHKIRQQYADELKLMLPSSVFRSTIRTQYLLVILTLLQQCFGSGLYLVLYRTYPVLLFDSLLNIRIYNILMCHNQISLSSRSAQTVHFSFLQYICVCAHHGTSARKYIIQQQSPKIYNAHLKCDSSKLKHIKLTIFYFRISYTLNFQFFVCKHDANE